MLKARTFLAFETRDARTLKYGNNSSKEKILDSVSCIFVREGLLLLLPKYTAKSFFLITTTLTTFLQVVRKTKKSRGSSSLLTAFKKNEY